MPGLRVLASTGIDIDNDIDGENVSRSVRRDSGNVFAPAIIREGAYRPLLALASGEEDWVAYHFLRRRGHFVHSCPENKKAAEAAAFFGFVKDWR